MRRSIFLRFGVAVCLLLFATVHPASAHRDLPPFISAWGPFESDVLACQRNLGQADRRCVSSALLVLEGCLSQQLSGNPCGEGVIKDAVQATKDRAERQIAQSCNDSHAPTLYFLNRSEMLTDKNIICTKAPDAWAALIYDPAARADWQVDASTATCVAATARLTSRYLRTVARNEARAVDRIASHDLPPSQVNAVINRCNQRVGTMRQRLVAKLTAVCPQFQSIYGKPLIDVILQAEIQAHCVVGSAYIQSAYTCPRGYFPPTLP